MHHFPTVLSVESVVIHEHERRLIPHVGSSVDRVSQRPHGLVVLGGTVIVSREKPRSPTRGLRHRITQGREATHHEDDRERAHFRSLLKLFNL